MNNLQGTFEPCEDTVNLPAVAIDGGDIQGITIETIGQKIHAGGLAPLRPESRHHTEERRV